MMRETYLETLKKRLENYEFIYLDKKKKLETDKKVSSLVDLTYLSGRMHELRVIINELKERYKK